MQTLKTQLNDLIIPHYRYRYENDTRIIQDKEKALRHGMNCEALAHLALREISGIVLPSELRCAEMYYDNKYFRRIAPHEGPVVGDVYWFGNENPQLHPDAFVPEYDELGDLKNWDDFAVKHMAVYIGQKTLGELQLLHTTPVTGRNCVWTLDDFKSHSSYRGFYGASRLRRKGLDQYDQ